MKTVLVLTVLLLAACSIPGLEDINSRIESVSTRMDDLEEAASSVPDIDFEGMEQRIEGIEQTLEASGVDVSPEASADILDAIAAVDSMNVDVANLVTLVEAQQESLAAASMQIRDLGGSVDSLSARIVELESEVAGLQSSSGGSGSGGTTGGRSGGTSGGRGGSSGGGTSGGGSGR
jgi:ABC-type phosphate/phosphonate transport system substrate-binding protein